MLFATNEQDVGILAACLSPSWYNLKKFASLPHFMDLLEPILGLLCLAAFVWFIADNLKARELGIQAARELCQKEGLLFLDDTVIQRGLRLRRDPETGHLLIQRTFAFEYSDTGDNRRNGSVTLLGHEVSMVYTGPRLVPQQAPLLKED